VYTANSDATRARALVSALAWLRPETARSRRVSETRVSARVARCQLPLL